MHPKTGRFAKACWRSGMRFGRTWDRLEAYPTGNFTKNSSLIADNLPLAESNRRHHTAGRVSLQHTQAGMKTMGTDEPSYLDPAVRVSKSKSYFTEDGQHFVLVYRTDSKYLKPIRLARADALKIAKRYALRRLGAPDLHVSPKAARYIYTLAKDAGLVKLGANSGDLLDTNMDLTVDITPEGSDSPVVVPKYFPLMDAGRLIVMPNDDRLDELTFVLSGVSPEQRTDPVVLKSGFRLKDLARMSSGRISPGVLLRQDHYYVLAHLHMVGEATFVEQWETAQKAPTGQSNTDEIKLMQKLEKFTIDPTGKELSNPANKDLFLQTRDNATDILSRYFRRIRRKLETFHEEPDPEEPVSIFAKLGLSRKKVAVVATAALVAPEARELSREYVAQSVKLGRILRSEVLRRWG